jgi:hypothetical protein
MGPVGLSLVLWVCGPVLSPVGLWACVLPYGPVGLSFALWACGPEFSPMGL